ncbi:MAG: FAD-dependent oxidoreductase [Chlorobi bacterium]|nr:FAD-dependent oxidoreductase [Chlorobiota bacterium]
MNKPHEREHLALVIGAGVAGSEAAYQLAQNGIRVIVVDQNALPYGKIEDGLPLWHIGLRDRVEADIDRKLRHPKIKFLPLFKLGKDMQLEDLMKNYKFDAIILAFGAWKDRPLPVPGIEKFRESGQLIYQNDLLKWYNHKHEPDYDGPLFEIKDGVTVIGGGLSSLDVMKIVMMELVGKALKEKYGLDYDLFTMEKRGLKSILEEHGLTLDDLGLKGATLVYRRSAREMPLKIPASDDPADKERAKDIAEKLLNTYREKFLFQFIPHAVPVDFEEKDGRLTALILEKTKTENGKVVKTGERFRHETPQVISSIGSVPVKLPGIPYEGDAIKTEGPLKAKVAGYENLFAVGNAVTGKGNIKMAKEHGREAMKNWIETKRTPVAGVVRQLDEKYLEDTDKRAESITGYILSQPIPTQEEVERIWELVENRRKQIGYTTYDDWIARHKPVRLEELLNKINKPREGKEGKK